MVRNDAAAAGIIYERQRGILDEPIPALNNKTPRAAASNPVLRPQLLRWMKFWISQTDRRNLETGRNDDTNWMVRELGLTEILFEPPPPRPRQRPRVEWRTRMRTTCRLTSTCPTPGVAGPALDATGNCQNDRSRAQDVLTYQEAADYFADLEYPLFPDLNDLLGEELRGAEIIPFVPDDGMGRSLLCSSRDAPAGGVAGRP